MQQCSDLFFCFTFSRNLLWPACTVLVAIYEPLSSQCSCNSSSSFSGHTNIIIFSSSCVVAHNVTDPLSIQCSLRSGHPKFTVFTSRCKTQFLNLGHTFFQGVALIHRDAQYACLFIVSDALGQSDMSAVVGLNWVLLCLLFQENVLSFRVVKVDEPLRRCTLTEAERCLKKIANL